MFRPPHQIDFYSYRPKGLKLSKEAFIERERMLRECRRNLLPYVPLATRSLRSKARCFCWTVKPEEHPAGLSSSQKLWPFKCSMAGFFLAL